MRRVGAGVLALALTVRVVGVSAQTDRPLPRTDAEAELRFREANEAFLAGDHATAIDGYRALVAAGYGTADVQHNLGTAALQAGRLGLAVLALERALRLDPRHDDARANLEAARSRNVDKLVGATDGPPFLERLTGIASAGVLSWAFAGCWLVLLGALIVRRHPAGRRWPTAVLLLVGLVGTVLTGAVFANLVWHRERVREVVVMERVIQVRKGPAPRFEVAFEIHEGLAVRGLDTDGPYQRIRLDNGLEGWVLRSAVEEI